MSKRKKILIWTAGAAVVLFFVFSGSIILGLGHFAKSYATSHETSAGIEDNEEFLALINEAGHATLPEQDPDADTPDEPAAFTEQEEEMLTEEPVRLSDIYSESGSTAIFKCFDTDAESYEWEYYDLRVKEWTAAEQQEVQTYKDELNRRGSCLRVKAEKDRHGLMVRCIVHFYEKEDEVQTASLFILKDEIKDIQAGDFTTGANTYISARELPVKVTYKDGSMEDITGLNDFYFLVQEEEKDYSTSISGNRIETTMLITTECDYLYAGWNEEQVPVVRYRAGNREEALELTCKITGQDLFPPVMSDITIRPYEVSNIDKPAILTVTILAEDDITPYPDLEYAFVFTGDEPEEADWIKKPTFDICIDRNGSYTAYCRDQAGNISQMEKEIITVDTKAPVINSVSLTSTSGWCRSNTIIVEAQDAGRLSYCFENKSAGITSDWITFHEYSVDTNGTWYIRIRDEAGNTAETETEVSNIDREAPVIHRISVK